MRDTSSASPTLSAHHDRAGAVDRPGQDLVARCAGARPRLSRHRGILDRRGTFQDAAIDGEPLARPHLDAIARHQFCHRHFARAVGLQSYRRLRQQRLDARRQSPGLALGGGLDELAERDERGEHRGGVEVNVPLASNRVSRAHAVRRKRAEGDEGVEAQPAPPQLARRALQEGIDENRHRRRRQGEHDPPEGAGGVCLNGARVERQGDHHDVHRQERADAQAQDIPRPRPLPVLPAHDAANQVTAVAAEERPGGRGAGEHGKSAMSAGESRHDRGCSSDVTSSHARRVRRPAAHDAKITCLRNTRKTLA
jgi:hypothetical protein